MDFDLNAKNDLKIPLNGKRNSILFKEYLPYEIIANPYPENIMKMRKNCILLIVLQFFGSCIGIVLFLVRKVL